ncbi:ATP-binding protein [Streptomyces sp. NPDC048508]|uniref:ATP-binding protein n=1 Tax=Streptomyces sp. NPDC048508 TaxID=3365561 RepID=UPI003717B4A3
MERFAISRHRSEEAPSDQDALRVRAMRRVTQENLVSNGLGCVADDATLVVSELITNAVQHSGGEWIGLIVELRNGVLHIRVHDGVATPRSTNLRKPNDDDEDGRGLALVRHIALSRQGAWGVSDGGATTWCELTLDAL